MHPCKSLTVWMKLVRCPLKTLLLLQHGMVQLLLCGMGGWWWWGGLAWAQQWQHYEAWAGASRGCFDAGFGTAAGSVMRVGESTALLSDPKVFLNNSLILNVTWNTFTTHSNSSTLVCTSNGYSKFSRAVVTGCQALGKEGKVRRKMRNCWEVPSPVSSIAGSWDKAKNVTTSHINNVAFKDQKWLWCWIYICFLAANFIMI